MGQPLWAGVDAGKSDHYCVVIDADGKRLLSRRVANDEAALLELINAITALADSDELTWAIDLNAGGAALLIALLIGAEQRLPVLVPQSLSAQILGWPGMDRRLHVVMATVAERAARGKPSRRTAGLVRQPGRHRRSAMVERRDME